MAIEVRKVSYSYDSVLAGAGLDGYRLDCFVWRDGKPVVDRHETYPTKVQLFEAMAELMPLLEALPETSDADEPAAISAASA